MDLVKKIDESTQLKKLIPLVFVIICFKTVLVMIKIQTTLLEHV